MGADHKRLNQKQFAAHAQNFVTSAVHAQGYSLQRLVELVAPQPDWRALDVATGAGHTALAFARHVRMVTASDLTHTMLRAARQHAAGKGAATLTYCQADAERLPFASALFDCVTCRIAAHHFADAAGFVQEAARVLAPGGIFAVADNITPGEPKIARYANLVDRFRDPSHHWAYTLDDWETFFFASNLQIRHIETFRKATDFDEWAARIGVRGDDLTRLRALLIRAPIESREWFAPRLVGQRLIFDITEAIIIGQKG